MLSNKFFPYSSMQEINLDWILTKVKNLMRFLPDDGSVGQILRRTAHGAEWSNEQGGGGAVNSVNGQTGDVVLTASDVGALPDTTVIPTNTSDLNNDSGFVDAAGAAAAAPVQKVNGQTGTVTINKTSVGLGNVANVLQYSASNPPPYPVTSVNSQTGAVSLTIPTDTGDLTNGAGYVTAAGAAAAAPVQSVNGLTGSVTIPYNDGYYHSGDVINFGTGDGTIITGIAVSASALVCDLLLPYKFTASDTITSTVSCYWIRGLGSQPAAGSLATNCELRGTQSLRLVITGSGMSNMNVYAANIIGTITFD